MSPAPTLHIRAVRRLSTLFVVTLVMIGLVVGAISCAAALGAGAEHEDHADLELSDAVVQPTSGHIDRADTAHGVNHREPSDQGAPGNPVDSGRRLPSDPTNTPGFDMACFAVAQHRTADPVVATVDQSLSDGGEASPTSCTPEPDSPVPKSA